MLGRQVAAVGRRYGGVSCCRRLHLEAAAACGIPQVAPEESSFAGLSSQLLPATLRQEGTKRGLPLLNHCAGRSRSARRLAQAASRVAPATETFFNELEYILEAPSCNLVCTWEWRAGICGDCVSQNGEHGVVSNSTSIQRHK